MKLTFSMMILFLPMLAKADFGLDPRTRITYATHICGRINHLYVIINGLNKRVWYVQEKEITSVKRLKAANGTEDIEGLIAFEYNVSNYINSAEGDALSFHATFKTESGGYSTHAFSMVENDDYKIRLYINDTSYHGKCVEI